jgi:large subunit ribosomal protein L22
MEVTAKLKYMRLAPRKARDLVRVVQGLPVDKALTLIQFSERKAATMVRKALKSAIANAENNARLHADKLWVKEAIIEEGPVFKRFWPRARGMVSHIRRRTSHIKITLTDEQIAR